MRGIPFTENIGFNKTTGTYYVAIFFNGKRKQLATGRTLIEALMMRDWCEGNGWKKFVYRHQYIQKRGENAYQIYKDFKVDKVNHREIFGTFPTLEEAIRERDLLIKYDWDIEALCALE